MNKWHVLKSILASVQYPVASQMPQPAKKKTLIVLYYQVAGIEMVKMMQPSSPGPDLSYLFSTIFTFKVSTI